MTQPEPITAPGVYTTFTFTCQTCGSTVQVIDGTEQPHDCTETSMPEPDPTAAPTDAQREWVERQASAFSEVYAVEAAKRCGVQWAPWMGDWFTSWSPRNGNSNAEGTWDHWVDLAVRILQDPLTGLVRPDAQAAVRDLAPVGFYDESNRDLTDDELALRFAPTGDADA